MLAPALLVVVGLFASGLVVAVLQSLDWVGVGTAGAPTLVHYADLLQDREFQAALGLTAWVASATTLLSAALGLATALALLRLTRGRRAAYALLQVPLGVPHLVMAVGLITLAAPSGWLARVAYALGLIAEPADVPALVHDGYGIGIILAYVAKEVPFLAVVATALLLRVERDYDAVARTLGASPWQRFRYVTWPLVAPGVATAALVVFAFVFAAFETPFLVGRPYPSMLAVVAQRRYMSVELADRPGAVALALIMTALSAVAVVAYLRISRSSERRARPMVF